MANTPPQFTFTPHHKITVTLLLLCLSFFATTSFADTGISYQENIAQENIAQDDSNIPSLITETTDGNNTEVTATGTTLVFQDDLQSINNTAEGIWKRIQLGYAIPNLESPYTAKHETWYSSKPEYMKRMLERSQRYLFHIVQEVEKRGMPTEIALLPMIESGFNPQAVSTSKAVGLWQFMPATGKYFGLKQTWWTDNRRDITAGTDAALTYLQKLHAIFGTWDLALAAYNAGEGTIQRAIESNRRKGLPTDYQSLELSEETKNYVPKLQAIKNIMTSPERYGLTIQPIADQPYFKKVKAPKQIDAKLAAKLAEIPYEEFSALNPEYNRPVLTGSGDHEFLLPISVADTFEENLANNNKPLVTWQTYYAKRGERMDKIARKFGINVAQLRSANNLPTSKKMSSAKQLMIPTGKATHVELVAMHVDSSPEPEKASKQVKKANKHVVKKNETLISIADHYGVSVKFLKEKNRLKTSKLKSGQKLIISAQLNIDSQSNA